MCWHSAHQPRAIGERARSKRSVRVVIAISLLIVVAPVGALWLFTLGTGATIDSWFSSAGVSPARAERHLGCSPRNIIPSSVAWWLLLLIPLASYIIGGRAAAHIARADSLRDGALAGLADGGGADHR